MNTETTVDIEQYQTKWERAVQHQERKGLAALETAVRGDHEDLVLLVSKGIRKICLIGKRLEAIKRLAGHGRTMEVWARLGYSQPQAAKYIEASKWEPLLIELQKRESDVLGIAQAYKAAVQAKRVREERQASTSFDDAMAGMETEELADIIGPQISKKRAKVQADPLEKLRKDAEKLIGQMELFDEGAGETEIVAKLRDYCDEWLRRSGEVS